MKTEILDTLGLKCPQHVLQIAVKAPDMKPGDILEVLGDCPTFEKDVRTWCERLKKSVPLHKGRRGRQEADPDTVLEKEDISQACIELSKGDTLLWTKILRKK